MTSNCYNGIGSVYHRTGKFSSAILNYEKALTVGKLFYDEEHPSIATQYNNLGTVYETIKDFEMASIHYDKAFEIFMKTLGENHPNTKLLLHKISDLKKKRS